MTIAPDSDLIAYDDLVDVTDLFKVTNIGDEPFHIRWDNHRYNFPPGVEQIVPFDVVRIAWGDPRAGLKEAKYPDSRERQVGWINSRDKELMRLATIYGLYADKTGDLPTYNKVPKATITTTDGAPVFVPCFYPDLDHIHGHAESEETAQDMVQVINRLQSKINSIEKIMQAQKKNPMDDDVPVDGPPSL